MLKGFKSSDYLFKPKQSLAKKPTRVAPFYTSSEDYNQKLDSFREILSERHDLLYADARHGLLVIFQGMDAAGKDGSIKHVMSGLNPQGVIVSSFGEPSIEEKSHDFLWRTHSKIPPRGKIGIFNRSYYEDVLTVRVHATDDGDPKFFSHRLEDIAMHERHLCREFYRIVKFYLHISPGEQFERLLARIDNKKKNWKFALSDLKDSKKWEAFQDAANHALSSTSVPHAPWYVIPADDKKNARLMISAILTEHMKAMPLELPHQSWKRKAELEAARKILQRRQKAAKGHQVRKK